LLNWDRYEVFKLFIDYLIKLAQKERVVFIRIRPGVYNISRYLQYFRKKGFRNAPYHLHAEVTWELDLSPSLEIILRNMRKTTRYCIRKAEKLGVKVTKSNNIKDAEILYSLQLETARRHKFTPFSREYLVNEFKIFVHDDQAKIFLAHYKREIISSAMIIFYGDMAVYHYAGSCLKYPKIPASYLLQWEAIKEAKKRGCRIYNFWGIAPKDTPRHPWAGLTLFKKGFGGKRVDYLHAQDLPLKWKYWLVWVIESLRRTRRGL
jgi:lipid II:glycine glycyltransferase (peptidoglycan interpeptide bridge formation enzyme)